MKRYTVYQVLLAAPKLKDKVYLCASYKYSQYFKKVT